MIYWNKIHIGDCRHTCYAKGIVYFCWHNLSWYLSNVVKAGHHLSGFCFNKPCFILCGHISGCFLIAWCLKHKKRNVIKNLDNNSLAWNIYSVASVIKMLQFKQFYTHPSNTLNPNYCCNFCCQLRVFYFSIFTLRFF